MRQALELALEALEEAWYHVGTFQPTEKAIDLYDEARTAIKEALAQPEEEKLHPVHIGVDVTREGTAVTAFYRKPDAVMEMFYSQFYPMAQPEQWGASAVTHPEYIAEQKAKTQELRSMLAQPEQEPVAWMLEGWGPDCGPYFEIYRDDEMGWRNKKEWTPLYTTPPQRTWVGLTHEELCEIVGVSTNDSDWNVTKVQEWLRKVEAKLKEKNT